MKKDDNNVSYIPYKERIYEKCKKHESLLELILLPWKLPFCNLWHYDRKHSILLLEHFHISCNLYDRPTVVYGPIQFTSLYIQRFSVVFINIKNTCGIFFYSLRKLILSVISHIRFCFTITKSLYSTNIVLL